MGSDAYKAAFEASIVTRFNAQLPDHDQTTFWSVAPSNPTSGNLFSNPNTYTRPGASYIALRAILGADNFRQRPARRSSTTYGGGSISPPQEIAIFQKWMPNKSIGCSNKLDAFFKQWWDTAYTGSRGGGQPAADHGPGPRRRRLL